MKLQIITCAAAALVNNRFKLIYHGILIMETAKQCSLTCHSLAFLVFRTQRNLSVYIISGATVLGI